MRVNRLSFLAIILVGFPVCGQAQNPHVRSNYATSVNTTIVETDLIHLNDTPDQFVQLFLRSSYKGKTIIKGPDKIVLTLISTSSDALYEFEGLRNLSAITDGKKWGVREVSRVVMRGDIEKGNEIFVSEGAFVSFPVPAPPTEGSGVSISSKGVHIPVPMSAKVRRGKSVKGLVTEYMQASLTLDQLIRISGAHRVEFRLGKTLWELSNEHRTMLRDFARMVTPN